MWSCAGKLSDVQCRGCQEGRLPQNRPPRGDFALEHLRTGPVPHAFLGARVKVQTRAQDVLVLFTASSLKGFFADD